jgi:hypothetical protein
MKSLGKISNWIIMALREGKGALEVELEKKEKIL